jgi:hypothetical protein
MYSSLISLSIHVKNVYICSTKPSCKWSGKCSCRRYAKLNCFVMHPQPQRALCLGSTPRAFNEAHFEPHNRKERTLELLPAIMSPLIGYELETCSSAHMIVKIEQCSVSAAAATQTGAEGRDWNLHG